MSRRNGGGEPAPPAGVQRDYPLARLATVRTGGANHLAGVALQQATGARWQYVPYKGGSQAIQDTVAGQCEVMMNGMQATLPHVQSGKLRLLGVSKRTRMPLVGDVPTIAEQGVPGYETGTWQGVLAPRGTPEAIVQRLNAEIRRALETTEVRERLRHDGITPNRLDAKEFTAFVADELRRWGPIVRASGAKND